MRRVAAIDCGTNSLRLLVADLDEETGHAIQVERRTTIVRLGQRVDRTGVFSEAALERTFATLDDYVSAIGSLGAESVRMVATSAARDVENRDDFIAGVAERVGAPPDIISGDEEARLSYHGATRELAGLPGIEAPILVVDIGGGSTEFVTQSGDGQIRGQSVDVGSVRLTERHLRTDPPTDREIAAVVDDVGEAIGSVELPLDQTRTLVGVAGTVVTMGAMVLDLPAYDRDVVNRSRLASPDVLAAVDRVVRMTVERRRALAFMHPDRADVIGAGALILGGVVRRVGLDDLVVSSHDILDGIAWSQA